MAPFEPGRCVSQLTLELSGNILYHDMDAVVRIEVPFVDAHVIECDSNVQEYTIIDHDVTIRIPPGAISGEVKVWLEAAVMMYGPFQFDSNMQAISLILWLCLLEELSLQCLFEVILSPLSLKHITRQYL